MIELDNFTKSYSSKADPAAADVSLTIADGVPVKMNVRGSEVMVYAGDASELYWIDQKGTADEEAAVLDYVTKGFEQGAIDILDFNEERISVIKVGSSYYCRKVPFTSLPLDEGASE